MKKTIALILSILTVIGLCVPASAATQTAGFALGSFLVEEDGYVRGIPKDTTADVVLANFKEGATLKDSAGAELTGSDVVGTGSAVSLARDAVIVIVGDVNGDGKLTSIDYLRIKQYVSGKYDIEGAFFAAADVNSDGSIKSIDYLSVKQCFSGKKDLYEGMSAQPFVTDLPINTIDTSKQRMNRNAITIGVFRYDGELWNDEKMSEFKNDWGGDYLMSYSARDTGLNASALYKLCNKHGVGIMSRNLTRYQYPNPGQKKPTEFDPDYTDFEAKLDAYKYNYNCVWGEDIYDEPFSTSYGWLNGAITRYNQRPELADRFLYINLTGMSQASGNIMGYGSATYTDYVRDFVKQVNTDYVCFDTYPFDYGTVAGLGRNYLYGMDLYSTAARESHRNMWVILQAGIDPAADGQEQKVINESQLRYQVYTSLAYGCKSIIYACYSPCWWQDGTAIVYQNGDRAPLWDVSQKLNHDMKFMSDTFCAYDSTCVFGVPVTSSTTGRQLRTQNKRAEERGFVGSRGFDTITPSGDLLVGAFEKKDGNGYAMMIVDQTDPYDTTVTNEVTFRTIVDGTVKCFHGGAETVLTPNADGAYTVTLASGDGAFITLE